MFIGAELVAYHLSLAPLNEFLSGEEDVRGRWSSTATIIAWSLVTLMVDKESEDLKNPLQISGTIKARATDAWQGDYNHMRPAALSVGKANP